MSRRVLTGDFLRLFVADSISTAGTVVSVLAVQLLLIDTLGADTAEIGLVRGAQFVPYLLFGLLGGVLADRMRRRPLLVAGDLVSTVAFGAIALLAIAGRLTVFWLAVLVFVAGTVTCLTVAAAQSFVPRLVPEPLLPEAFSRQALMGEVAGAAGPLAAGALVRFLSAPVAIGINALSFLLSALVTATIRTPEPRSEPGDRHVWRELREGARWVYGHHTLRPYAISLHVWFLGYAVMTTVEVYFATTVLHLDALTIGLVLASVGISAAAAAAYAPAAARRLGLGRAATWATWCAPLGTVVFASARPGTWGVVVLVAGHVIWGGTQLWSTLTMTYRTVVTPDRLRARMNATIRTVNWGGLALAALFGGWLATHVGSRTTLYLAAGIMAVAAAYQSLSPVRSATLS